MDRQVRRKAIEVEDVIDLHGLNAPRARAALRSFLKHSYQEDRRLVLVVTGKGRGEGKGVIRDGFLQWIDEADIRPLVARAAGARPRHGGAGAFYVFLKRKRRDRKRPNRGLHRA
jgi:DNA-nicking Smr family endonuclease